MDESKIPQDQDTLTLKSQKMTISGYKCIFEMWSWDGILGNSFIFDQHETSAISDNDLTSLVLESLGESARDVKVTLARKGSHSFVNVFFPDYERDVADTPELTNEDLQLRRAERDQWVHKHNAKESKKV